MGYRFLINALGNSLTSAPADAAPAPLSIDVMPSKLRVVQALTVAVTICGCATTPSTAPFYRDGREAVITQDPGAIAENRKGQTFPVPFQTSVPVRLQPLAVDFLSFFAGSRNLACKDYRVSRIERLLSEEKWTVNACGEESSYLITLSPCNKLLNSPFLLVKRESDGRTLGGANPLDATFLVACPDRKA